MGRGGEKRKEEEELERREIFRIIEGLKVRKAMGVDGVPNEVWKFGGKGTIEWVWRVCNKVWKDEGWPEEWMERMVVPIGKIALLKAIF